MPFAVKINGNLWMSFIDGDYRDYMKTCDNPNCECPGCTCDPCKCTKEEPCGCAKGTMPFSVLTELRGGQ
jgi:hypothetical protein|tara:strand:+ start:496 stop:705 length:210 start_codon:yes stop_codon:yes gene_type:complete